MLKVPQYNLRNAGTLSSDTEFLVAAFDSTLPFLSSIGGSEMWGDVPFSEKDGFLEETENSIKQSQSYERTGVGEKVRVFIVEVEIDGTGVDELKETGVQMRACANGKTWLSVAATCVHENWVPDYVTSHFLPSLQAGHFENTINHAYVEVMVADHRTGRYHKGAGSALLHRVVEFYREKGYSSVYVDGWAGNGRKLIDYYERQGFTTICDFDMERGNGKVWQGTLLHIRL